MTSARSPIPVPAILVAILLTGCASARISLDSSPSEAEVYATPVNGTGPEKKIGVTPLVVMAPDLAAQAGASGPVILEFRKDGYNPSRAVVTDLSAVDMTLKMELSVKSGLEDQDMMNHLVDQVFESQRLALAGRFDEALAKLKDVQKEAPQMAAAYELEGGIYFMQKKLTEALDSYRVASRYNPRNPETVRMRNYLEIKLGLAKEEGRQ